MGVFHVRDVFPTWYIKKGTNGFSPTSARLYRVPISFILPFLVSVFFCTICYGESHNQVENKVIMIGGDYDYPPYVFLNEKGQPDGYIVDLTKAIAKVKNINIEIDLCPWDQLRNKLRKNEIDIIQGIQKSPEREESLDFSEPCAIVSQSIFARKGGPKNLTTADLAHREVIVQRGGFMHEYLQRNAPSAVFIEVDTHLDALRLLAAGKHDFAVVGVPSGIYFKRKYPDVNVEPVSAPLSNSQYCYAVLKGRTDILKLFNSGLATLINTGVQQELQAKWLGGPGSRKDKFFQLLRYGAWVSSPIIILFILVMIWNNTLKRKVATRTRELEERQQQLIQADKLASLGILTSGVAHEINTPNGIFLMNLPVLIEVWQDARVILDEHFQEHGDFPFGGLYYSRLKDDIPAILADMFDGARRIRDIVNDLKSYARKEDPVDVVEIDLNEQVRSAIRLFKVSIRKATPLIKVDYDANLPLLLGNPQRLTQVVVNLIVNAYQALDSPDQTIKVRTRYDRPADNVILTVSDDGMGIPPEHLNKILDPFFTTKRESGGTGLGLAVSLSIVKEHGGNLTFESEPQHGTTVTVNLPVKRVT